MEDMIRRSDAVKLLREKAQGYTVSMFATSGECWVARTVLTEAAAEIANMPTLDVAPVRHGRWEEIEESATGHLMECSVCKEWIFHHFNYASNYCPNCGAKMDAHEPPKESE